MTKDKSIFIKNIYYMLAYAFDSLGKPEYEDLEKETFENVHDLFAFVLGEEISFLLKKGLYREYINRREDLSTARGKIDMSGTFRNKMKRKQALFCDFDELSENNLLNQILKTTAMLLIKHGEVGDEHKDRLKAEMHFFSNVDTLEPSSIKWHSVRFQRSSRSYQWPINLCEMAVKGILLTTEKGDDRLASFVDEQRMSNLYEKFTLNYYKKHRPDLSPGASEVSWALDDDNKRHLPAMNTDIFLQRHNTILIIDAKYYGKTMQKYHEKLSVRSLHLYQIFSYVKNCQFSHAEWNVSGMLLYAKTDEEIQLNEAYQMSGNKIAVRTLDLGVPFQEIASQLDAIANNCFGPYGA